MKNIISIYTLAILSLFIVSCTKTIGGVAGNITDEVKTVCDEKEAQNLEDSSQSITVWECE